MERVSPHIQTCRYIHTPSSFARQSLLYVQEAGHLKSRDRHISRRSHLESYLFFIVLRRDRVAHHASGKSEHPHSQPQG